MKKIITHKKEDDSHFYSFVDSKLYEFEVGENVFAFSYVKDILRQLMGKTLTVIDASISDKDQRKAMKDIIKGQYSNVLGQVANYGFDQDKLQTLLPEDVEEFPIQEIDLEKVLEG